METWNTVVKVNCCMLQWVMGLTSSARPKSKLIQVKPIPQINAIGKYYRESTRYLSRSDDEATEQTDQHSESLTNKVILIFFIALCECRFG